MKVFRECTAAAAIGVLIPALAWGQAAPAPPPVPGSVDPGRLPQRLQPAPAPGEVPPIATPEIPELVAPQEAAQTRFELKRIVVDESTVYTQDQLAALYAPLLNKTVSLADIYRVAEAITIKYRSDGYILSRAVVPAQRIAEGEVHIRAVEGFIRNVAVAGSTNKTIEAYAQLTTRSHPLRASDLERSLLLINDLPGISARAVLAPSPGVTGGSDLTITVEKAPVGAFVSLDNRGTEFIGPLQLFSQADVNDLTGRSDRLSLRYITAPTDNQELQFLQGEYTLPIGNNGLNVTVSGTWNRSLPGSTLHTDFLETIADGDSVSARLAYPLMRTRTETLSLDATFAVRNARVTQRAMPSEERLASSYTDHIRELRIGATYDKIDGWNGRNFFHLEVIQGLPILDETPNGRLTGSSRPGGLSTFTKGTLDASRLQNLDAVTPGLGLLGAISGGGSFGQTLLASEQFGVGGPQYGRGYDPAEISGDYGIAGKVELQYTFSPKLGGIPKLGYLVEGANIPLQLYGFYDAGVVWDQSPTLAGNPDKGRSLASTGFGVRANINGRLFANVELSKPLTRRVAVFAERADPKPLRFYFSVAARY